MAFIVILEGKKRQIFVLRISAYFRFYEDLLRCANL